MDEKKLLIFDVDGTLAPHGRPASREVAGALSELERRGHTVGFASGKTFEYLDGFARGIGLARHVVIAENGAVLFFEGALRTLAARPPFFDTLQRDVTLEFPGIRLQHNMVNLTVLAGGGALKAVRAYLESMGTRDNTGCHLYLHCDSAELLPDGVDKGRALAELKRLSGFAAADIIAAGNAGGDLPMRGEAGLFLAVGDEIDADRRFADAETLMAYLLEVCR